MKFKLSAFRATGGFSWQLAMNTALASKVAYFGASEIGRETRSWGFSKAEFFSQKRTQGFVAWDAHCVLVGFRGTKELGDWLTDLNAFRAEVSYGKVHKGFLEAFNDVRTPLWQLLRDAGAGSKKLWVTGHSLGGALSTIMAGEWLDQLKIHGIYTYGQPRVVNRQAMERYRQPYANRYFRFVNDDDIVPKVPALLQHVGQILWFNSKGDLKQAPAGVRSEDFGPEALTEEEFEAFRMMIRGIRPQINREHERVEEAPIEENLAPEESLAPVTRGILPSVRDHFMDKYLQKIWAKLQSQS